MEIITLKKPTEEEMGEEKEQNAHKNNCKKQKFLL